MARKVTISKDMILEAALKILIRDGYSVVNVKTISKEIGCSTQPIVWHFENMDGLRLALAEYAREYAVNRITLSGENAFQNFEDIGRHYVRMALNEPNLFKYLYLGESPMGRPYSLNRMARDIKNGANGALTVELAALSGLSEEQTIEFVRNTLVYSHGIATMVATGVFKGTEEEMMDMINYAADSFLFRLGIDLNAPKERKK